MADSPSRILVAEDEHLAAAEIAAMLGEGGYTVFGPARDGRRAIDLCRQTLPDLALVDIKMPEMTGFEAARVIYSELGIPVVILSAFAAPADISEAIEAGVFGYLIKPASEHQLRAAIEVAWERFREQAALSDEASLLRRRLEERRMIEQAKWELVKTRKITEPEALRSLQDRSRSLRRPLIEVALSVIEAAGVTNEVSDRAG
jgi:response regulator NasT